MPTLIKLTDRAFVEAENAFLSLADDDAIPVDGGVIVSIARFQTEGAALLDDGRAVGVRIEPAERVEDLAYDLPRLALIALMFPKFRDGRAYSTAALLRERLGFKGEIRAVGDVLREQAFEMVRCGFDAFAPADGSTPEQWAKAAGAFRHVYQAAADGCEPAFVGRSFPLLQSGEGGSARSAKTQGAGRGGAAAGAPTIGDQLLDGASPPLRRGG